MTRYERQRELGIYWYNKATDLRGAAALVWAGITDKDPSRTARRLGLGAGYSFEVACWPVYVMLCGLALELLLKAALVARGFRPGKTHDLLLLWSEVGIRASDRQKGVLAILSESVKWAGRYPVPNDAADFERLVSLGDRYLEHRSPLGDSGLEVLRYNGSLDWESFGRLWTIAHGHAALGSLFDDAPSGND